MCTFCCFVFFSPVCEGLRVQFVILLNVYARRSVSRLALSRRIVDDPECTKVVYLLKRLLPAIHDLFTFVENFYEMKIAITGNVNLCKLSG